MPQLQTHHRETLLFTTEEIISMLQERVRLSHPKFAEAKACSITRLRSEYNPSIDSREFGGIQFEIGNAPEWPQ